MKYHLFVLLFIACLGAVSCGPEKVRVTNANEEAIPVKMVDNMNTTTPAAPVTIPATDRQIKEYMLIIREDTSIVALVQNQIVNGWEPLGGVAIYGKEKFAQAMVRY